MLINACPLLSTRLRCLHTAVQGAFGLEVWSNESGGDFELIDEAQGTTASGGIVNCVHVVLEQQHHLLIMDDTQRLR